MYGPPLSPAEGENARRFGVRIERAVELLAREVATDWWTARRAGDEGDSALHGPEAVPWRRAWALGPPDGTSEERSWPASPFARAKRSPRRRTGPGRLRSTPGG
jgi:hypothetical protein